MKQIKVGLYLMVGLAGALLMGVALPSLTYAAPLIPPLPIPVPPAAPAPPVHGGFIALQAQFPIAWPWTKAHWQELWTVVQWQDAQGRWHDVTGWQGTLDNVTLGTDGTVTGFKCWWVAEADLNTGPFRWVVHRDPDGAVLGTSDPFSLPARARHTLTVGVALAP